VRTTNLFLKISIILLFVFPAVGTEYFKNKIEDINFYVGDYDYKDGQVIYVEPDGIYLSDGATNTLTIPLSTYPKEEPQLSNGTIAYNLSVTNSSRFGTHTFLYEPGTGITDLTNLIPDPIDGLIHGNRFHHRYPGNSSGRVIFQSAMYTPDGEQSGNMLYLYDSGSFSALSNFSDEKLILDPQIEGDHVAWIEYPNDNPGNFYQDTSLKFHNLTNGATDTVTSQIYEGEDFVTLHNGQAAWMGWTAISDTNLLVYDGTQFIGPIASDTGKPDIHNGRIVYSASNGNDSEVYLYDITTGQTINISNRVNKSDGDPKIYDNWVVWTGYDGNDNEIFLYNISTGEPAKQITFNDHNDSNSRIFEDRIIYRSGGNFPDFELQIAVPQKIVISNVGDGMSIRLTWPVVKVPNTKVYYNIYRRPLGTATWFHTNENETKKRNPADLTAETVEYYDTKKESDPFDQSDPDIYKGPIRGTIYEYKIELKELDNDNDDSNDSTLSPDLFGKWMGVTEPFILMARGYGGNNPGYWTAFKDYLEGFDYRIDIDINLLETYTDEGKVYSKPATVWDSALTFNLPDRKDNLYPPSATGPQYFNGQVDAVAAGDALFYELKDYWLKKEIRDNKDINRINPDINLILDWVPEEFHIISHSMGAPISRKLELNINNYQRGWNN